MEAPDDRGLRAVRVQGVTVGSVWSRRGLRRLLRRAGLPRSIDLTDPNHVRWLADPDCWPDRPGLRRAAAALMVAGLLMSAAVLFQVGMTDAFNALAYGGRVEGVVFTIAALVETLAALAVCDYWGTRRLRYTGAAVLVGVGTVTVTNLMFLITQAQGGEYTPFLWLWIGLLFWTVWAWWRLTRHRAWQGVPHPKGIAVSVLVSGVAGIASFAYSQMYVPYATPVRIPFTVSFGAPAVSPDGAVLHVPAHVEFRNAGSVRVYVVGTIVTVKGWPTKFTQQGTKADVWKQELWKYDETVRHVVYSPFHMLLTGMFSDPGDRLDPGDDFSKSFVVDVPLRAGIGRVQLDATSSFIRADRGKLGNSYVDSGETSWDTESGRHLTDAPSWVASPGDDFYRYHSKIYHSSEMLNLTRATDYASAWWVIRRWHEGDDFAKGDTSPELVASIYRDPQGRESLNDSEQEPYGMHTEEQWAEGTVDQLLKDAKK
ncbi:hypothetical protein ABT173_10025 [Streptomyces sp. NPDC001795]|uniref:hypothetical protein n=1 Tax=Streptomyces sp. NPDC001795 TaxID=3154525 RepID=UPI003321D08B